jgi:hypothetical protein
MENVSIFHFIPHIQSRILHATKVDVKSLVVHFTIQSINCTFRCQNDKEMKKTRSQVSSCPVKAASDSATKGEGDGKHIVVGFHHLQ